MSRYILAKYDDEASVRRLSLNQAKLLAHDEGFGAIVTAKGERLILRRDSLLLGRRITITMTGLSGKPSMSDGHSAKSAKSFLGTLSNQIGRLLD